MFSLEFSRNTRRIICMLAAAVIVTASFAYGAMKAQPEAHRGYTVTIVELSGNELSAAAEQSR
jgi:hypothetical protein